MRTLIVIFVCLALLYLRIPDAFNEPRFWAEDGAVFFSGWRSDGWASIWQPYSGYIHLLPRMIAATAAQFPVEFAACIYLWASVAATCWVGVIISRAFRGWVGFAAAAAPLIAAGSTETLGSPTNLQWIMAIGIACIVGSVIEKRWVGRGIFLVTASLSGPFSVFATPAFMVRALVAYRSRVWGELGISTAVILCGFIQAFVLVSSGERSGFDIANWAHLVGRIFRQSLGAADWIFAGIAGLILSVSLIVGAGRYQRLAMVTVSLGVIASAAAKFSLEPGVFGGGVNGLRYWHAPSAIAIIMFLTMIQEHAAYLKCAGSAGLIILASTVDISTIRRYSQIAYEPWPQAILRSEQGPTTYRFPPGWVIALP